MSLCALKGKIYFALLDFLVVCGYIINDGAVVVKEEQTSYAGDGFDAAAAR
jgi:hypothetical protein